MERVLPVNSKNPIRKRNVYGFVLQKSGAYTELVRVFVKYLLRVQVFRGSGREGTNLPKHQHLFFLRVEYTP